MAIYEEPLSGFTTDANGNATFKIGPLADKTLHFLGYVVARVGAGTAAATYELQQDTGEPLAGASGLLVVLGPVFIERRKYKLLKITGGPAMTAITGSLAGDVNDDIEKLLVRPTPSAGSPGVQQSQYVGKAITAGTEQTQVIAATAAGVALDLTGLSKSTAILTNQGPLRVQLWTSGAAGGDQVFATLYTDDIAIVAEPMLLTVKAPDGNQNLNVFTLQHT